MVEIDPIIVDISVTLVEVDTLPVDIYRHLSYLVIDNHVIHLVFLGYVFHS